MLKLHDFCNRAQPGYHLLNANLTYVDPSEKWRVALGVTNLTNRHYLVGGFSDLPATGFVDGTYARPREWYLTVRRNF
ncbi:TonB-dependent receptor [Sphingopyxis indica]|uniref:TonB-dependent receptor n=1 Tax=Sphingopyxis indica TaxID=436663 RepID=UPI002938D17F|nr:TonB-dependent receptor [Sphingopyxis indica]WOF43012.1 TonB-dependent receptor [Sphingopyxis indica]